MICGNNTKNHNKCKEMMKLKHKKKHKESCYYSKYMVILKEFNKKSKIQFKKIRIKKIEISSYSFQMNMKIGEAYQNNKG